MFPRVQSAALKYSSVAAPGTISTACPINFVFLEFSPSSPSFSPFSGSRFIPVQLFLFRCGFSILVFSSAARSAGIIWPPVLAPLPRSVYGARFSAFLWGVLCFFSRIFGIPSSPHICKRTEKHGKLPRQERMRVFKPQHCVESARGCNCVVTPRLTAGRPVPLS